MPKLRISPKLASYVRTLVIISSAAGMPPTASELAALAAVWALIALSALAACVASGTGPSAPPSVSFLSFFPPSDLSPTSAPVTVPLAISLPVILSAA